MSDMIFIILCLTSLSMIISRSIHVVANVSNSFFLWLSTILLYVYIYIHIFMYTSLFLCWWTFRLLPCLGYWTQCYNEHCIMIFKIYLFHILWPYWTHLSLLRSFFFSDSLEFSMYIIISSADKDSFISFFIIFMPLISFSRLLALTRVSSTRLSKSGENRHPCYSLGGKYLFCHL